MNAGALPFAAKLCLAISILFWLQACGGESSAESTTPAIAVETQVMATRSVPISIHYPGRAEGSKEVEVRARVEGILLQRHYKEGEAVTAGQLLYEIDDAPFTVALDRAQAQLAQAKAGLSAAQRRWDRASELIKRDAISKRESDDAQSELELAQANVQLAEAEVRAAKINLDYTKVRAPIAGVTSREQVSEGSLVGPSNSLLTRISQLDPIWVTLSVPDNVVLNLRSLVRSDELRFREDERQVRVETADGQSYPHPGEINFTESAVDRQTGTIQLRATLPNPEGQLLPGQFLRVFLEGLYSVDTLALPERAVMQSAQGSYVYRVNDQGEAEVAPIKLGLRTEQGVIVTSGLRPGDRIVVEGMGRVEPGEPLAFADAGESAEEAPTKQTAQQTPAATETAD